MNQRVKIVAVIGGVILAGYLLGNYFFKGNSHGPKMAGKKGALVRPHSPVMGSPDAPVELVEFLDPECETCSLFYPFVKKLMADHPGKVRLVVRYAPFHHNSVFAVKVLEAARLQGKYWETLALLFEKQSEWGSHHNPAPEKIWGYLPGLGLDVEKIRSDMNSPAVVNIIETDMSDVDAVGVQKTPGFFINGEPLRSFGYQQLKNAVEEAIPK